MINNIKKYETNDKIYNSVFSKKYGLIMAFFIVAIFTTIPLLADDYITSNDMTFHMYRISEIAENLKHGILLPSLQSNNILGYGYLVDVFYPSLFLYPAALLTLIGINPLIAIKITFFLINFVTPVISYKAAISATQNQKFSFYFAVVYAVFPYRVLNALANGFMGEFIAATFLPLVFLGCYKLLNDNKWSMIALGMIALLYSHLISLLLAACYLAIFFFVFHAKDTFKKSYIIIGLIKAAIVTILCGAAFLLPFLDVSFSDSFKYDYNAEQSGIVPLNIFVVFEFPWWAAIIVQVALIFGLNKLRSFLIKKTSNPLLSNSICITAFLVVMLTDLFPWKLLEYIPYLRNIQFSVRIMPFAMFFMTLIVVDSILAVKDFNIVFILAFMAVNLTVVIIPTTRECRFIDYSSLENIEEYEEGSFLDVIAAEYVPRDFSINGVDLVDITCQDLFDCKKPVLSNKNATCTYSRNNCETTIELTSDEPTDMLLGLTYYKYYKAFENGSELPIYEQDGRILLKGITTGSIVVRYEVSLLQKMSAVFSVFSVIIFFGYLSYIKRNKLSAND